MGTIAELDEFFGGSVVEFFAARAMGSVGKHLQIGQVTRFLRPERFQGGVVVGPALGKK